uniref:Ribosomal protein L20 n=1 Tax=Panagrolaimus davidi TaxID=227884 RepID=A0A914PXZ9_9BILA
MNKIRYRKANRYILWKGIFNAFFVTRCLILPNTVLFLFFRKRSNVVKCASERSYAVTDQSALYFTELRRQWGIKI